jgi:hypothetical protein
MFAAKVLSGGRTFAASARFDLSGQATGVVARAGTNVLVLDLQVDLTEGTDRIVGSVNGGTWMGTVLADRSVFHAVTNRAPFAGKYTTAIAGGDGLSSPGGQSVGAISIDAVGKIRLSGTLADGTPLTQTASVSKYGDWPLYVSLYGGKGSLVGWLTFTNEAGVPTGSLRWIKLGGPTSKYYPLGFTNEINVAGSTYVAPSGPTNPVLSELTDGVVIFTGPSESWTNNVIFSVNNKVSNLSSNKLAFTITLPTGLFQGSVAHPTTGKSLSFKGVLLQEAGQGVGYFLTTNQSGSVYFGIAPTP